jgi:hypothetical protein
MCSRRRQWVVHGSHLHPEEWLGRLVVVCAAAAALWTLNRSSDPAVFGVARLVGGVVVALLSYVLLSFPEGRLHSRLERWVVAGSGAVIAPCAESSSLCLGQPPSSDWV